MNKLGRHLYWFLPIALMIGMAVFYGFNGLYGQDSHEYLRFASAWKSEGISVELLESFRWPLSYPFVGVILSYLGIPMMWSLNIVSLLSAIGCLVYTNKSIKLIYGKSGHLWLLLSASTQVYFIRGGILVMSDMLCAFLVAATIYFLLKYRESAKWSSILLVLFFAEAAVLTRYASLPIIAPIVLYAGYLVLVKAKRIVQVGIPLFIIVLVILVYLFNNQLVSIGWDMFEEWNLSNLVSVKQQTPDGVFYKTVPNLLYVFGNFFHIGYLAIGILLVPFYKYSSKAWKDPALIIPLVFYFLVIVGLTTQNYRFLMISHPIALLVLFGAFDRLNEVLKKRKLAVLLVIGALMFNASFFVYSFRKTYAVHHDERVVAEAIKKLNFDGTIYTFFVDQSFPSYGINNQVKNLYLEQYDTFDTGAIVIYNANKFEEQWKSTNVVINWEQLNREYTLDTLQLLENNWGIYEVK